MAVCIPAEIEHLRQRHWSNATCPAAPTPPFSGRPAAHRPAGAALQGAIATCRHLHVRDFLARVTQTANMFNTWASATGTW